MTRYYQGPDDKQPQDCGRRHPQPLCMCVMCEIADRFASIEAKQDRLALLQAIRRFTAESPARKVPR